MQNGSIVRTTLRANDAALGGALVVGGEGAVTDSTIDGNTAANGGAGVFVGPSGNVIITNSTVSGNSTAGQGGGVTTAGSVTLNNCTVADNSAGLGSTILNNGSVTLSNTLVSGESFTNGQVNTGGGNIESPGNTLGLAGPGDQVDVSAQDLALGSLDDNGGPTETHALLAGSVAIDRIPVDDCIVDADQRGEPRPGGTSCDVGAFEVQ